MNDTNREITIVTVCDNHYAVMLAALLKSIEVNYKGSGSISLYIIDDGLKEKTIERLVDSVDVQIFAITLLKLHDIIPDKSKLPLDNSTFPLNVYVRLFIPHIIPPSSERVLYLDVDMIVETDVSKLWDIEMEGKVVAGVVDRSGTVSSTWGGITNYKDLGLEPDTKYFNSGLLLINPVSWREQNITDRILTCIKENNKYAGFPDQYGLNVVLAGLWHELDSRWNCYAMSTEQHPFIIHFIGIKPIYTSYEYSDQYRERFFFYLSSTKWSDFKPISNNFRLLKKLYNKLFKKWLNMISGKK